MAYKIAVGTSDGINVDLKFGEVQHFFIFKVENLEYRLIEKRAVNLEIKKEVQENETCSGSGCNAGGCSGNGHGCSGQSDVIDKVTSIEDCRCIVCAKIGFQAQKQLEKKAISVFDVECKINEALDKITAYYDKLDSHKLRKINC